MNLLSRPPAARVRRLLLRRGRLREQPVRLPAHARRTGAGGMFLRHLPPAQHRPEPALRRRARLGRRGRPRRRPARPAGGRPGLRDSPRPPARRASLHADRGGDRGTPPVHRGADHGSGALVHRPRQMVNHLSGSVHLTLSRMVDDGCSAGSQDRLRGPNRPGAGMLRPPQPPKLLPIRTYRLRSSPAIRLVAPRWSRRPWFATTTGRQLGSLPVRSGRVGAEAVFSPAPRRDATAGPRSAASAIPMP